MSAALGKKKELYFWKYTLHYVSPRYGLEKTIPKGYPTDGASGPAMDIYSESWVLHDSLIPCFEPIPPEYQHFWESNGYWDCGTPCHALASSLVLHDILLAEGRPIRAKLWFIATYAYQWRKQRRYGW